MTFKRTIGLSTLIFFMVTILHGVCYPAFSQNEISENQISKLLKKAEEHYQNGEFTRAIEVYENIIKLLNEKKELAQTKQKLNQTMLSLALTYFTIQENAKAKSQLEKLIQLNPNLELDSEFYPPGFIGIFKETLRENTGSINLISMPPGAEITFDTVMMGKTPLVIKNYFKGEYQLTARLSGYADHIQTIAIKPNQENRIVIQMQSLKKEKKPAVIEKETPKPVKKKKKFPLLLVLGGAAAVILAIILLSGKSDEEPDVKTGEFNNNQPAIIHSVGGGWSLIQVEGIPASAIIDKIEYDILIQHPDMSDLIISLIGTDNRTTRILWNRQESSSNPTPIHDFTTVFNSLDTNGIWKLLVQNGGSSPGQINRWLIKIYYH